MESYVIFFTFMIYQSSGLLWWDDKVQLMQLL